MFTSAKGKATKVDSTASFRNSESIISHVTFWDCNARTFFHITFHEIAVCVGSILPLVEILLSFVLGYGNV